jgi:FAD synthase
MSVEFIDRVRSEMRFSSVDELRDQIQRDVDFAKQRLTSF